MTGFDDLMASVCEHLPMADGPIMIMDAESGLVRTGQFELGGVWQWDRNDRETDEDVARHKPDEQLLQHINGMAENRFVIVVLVDGLRIGGVIKEILSNLYRVGAPGCAVLFHERTRTSNDQDFGKVPLLRLIGSLIKGRPEEVFLKTEERVAALVPEGWNSFVKQLTDYFDIVVDLSMVEAERPEKGRPMKWFLRDLARIHRPVRGFSGSVECIARKHA
jgi:hypothetical protein